MGKEKLLKKALEVFAGRHVLEFVLNEKENAFNISGETINGTISYYDIKQFTNLTHSISPEMVIKFLNAFLRIAVETVYKYNGVVDKIIGNSLLVYWNENTHQNHAELACKCTLEFQSRIKKDLDKNLTNLPVNLSLAIGIHSGEFVLGNFGCELRLDYCIMGNAVNLATRLSGSNIYFSSEIIISEATKNIISNNFLYRELDVLTVKGKAEPLILFELLDNK